MLSLIYLLIEQKDERLRLAARAASERLKAQAEGRDDAQTRIDIGIIVEACATDIMRREDDDDSEEG